MSHVSAVDRSHQFVEAAARVIAREGLAAATTRRIAAEAEAPLAALHYCFRSKDDLLEEVYHFLSRDYARELEPVSAGAPLDEVVHEHAYRIWRRMLATPHEQVTTFELLLRRHRLKNDHELDRALEVNRTMYDAWITSTASIFHSGATASGIVPSVDPGVAARFFIAAIDGISLQHLADPDEDRSWQLIDATISAVLNQLGWRRELGE